MQKILLNLILIVIFTCCHAHAYPYRLRALIGDVEYNSASQEPSEPEPEEDVTPPSIIARVPLDDAADVWTTASLVLTFDENVVAGSGSIVISNADHSLFESIPVTDGRVSFSGDEVTITPATIFVAGSSYYVTFASGVFEDTSGNVHAGLANSTDWNFTIAAAPEALQSVLGTNGAMDWEVFSDGGQTWMLVSNNGSYPGSNISSPLFRFAPENPDDNKVVFVEDVMTYGSYGWTSVQAGGETYIFGSFHNDGNWETQSPLYRFVPGNPDGSKMQLVETVTTYGPVYPEFFAVDGEAYLLIPNDYNGSTWDLNSFLYHLVPGNPDGSKLELLQNIATSHARGFMAFEVDGETYVMQGDDTTTSKLYHFVPENPDTSKLVLLQTVPSNWALRWHHFEVGGEHYLAVANYNTTAQVFRFDPNGSPMVSATPMQTIALTQTSDWHSFTYGGTTYLILAQVSGGHSYLYQFHPENPDSSKLQQVQVFDTTYAMDWTSFVAGGNTYLAVANRGAFYGDTSLSEVFRFYP